MATYFVSLTGSDTTGTGTILNPWQTHAKGISVLNPGDTLYLRGGTWPLALNLSAKTGTAANWITVAAYPGDGVGAVTIQPSLAGGCIYGTRYPNCAYFIIDGFKFDGINGPSSAGLNVDSLVHDWIFQNLDVFNWRYNAFFVGSTLTGRATNITIRNCKLHDQIGADIVGQRYYGVYINEAYNFVLDNNDIYHNPGGGMQVYPGPQDNITISNNRIHHNNHVNYATVSIGGILVYSSTSTNVKIYNNLIYNNGSPLSGNATGIEVNANSTGVKVWNNTVYGNKSYGIFLAPGTNTNEVRNNIVYGNGLSPQYLDQGSSTISSNNLQTNPSFVDATNFDFHLQLGSAAINAGIQLNTQFTTDLDGVTRGTTWDIGAYEYSVSGDTTPPAVPTGLQVI